MYHYIFHLKQSLEKLLEFAVIAVVGALVLDVLWGVCTRFLLNSPSRWTEEVAIMLLIWVSLLGAAVAFGRGQHLGVDYFVKKLDPSAQRLMAGVVQLVVMAFATLAMVYGGYMLVTETFQSGQLTPALGIKKGYAYLPVPISGVFILLFCGENFLELIRGKSENIVEDNQK